VRHAQAVVKAPDNLATIVNTVCLGVLECERNVKRRSATAIKSPAGIIKQGAPELRT